MELLSWCSFELPLIFVGFAGSAKSPRQCTFKITRKAKPGSVRAYRRWGCFIWAESVQAKVGCFLAYKNIFCRSTGQILCRKIGPKLGPMMQPLPSVSSGAPWFGLPCYFGSVSLRWFGTLTTKKVRFGANDTSHEVNILRSSISKRNSLFLNDKSRQRT